MQVWALGAIELSVDGQPRPLGPAQRLLLAVLVASRRRVVSADALTEALWGDAPPATARPTLQTHLSKLRRAMGDRDGTVVVNRPPGYLLDVAHGAVDAARFDVAVGDARRLLDEDPGDALVRLDRALGWWRGPAFAEFAETDWARPEARRLEELRLVALELRNDARLALGVDGAAIGELEGLVAEHPLRERFWAQLMVALHRTGRQAEALRVGQALRRHLREELGLEPSSSFRDLEAAVVTDAPSVGTCRPPPGSPGGRSSQSVATTRAAPWSSGMPGLAAELVGRVEDLDALVAALARGRLVTLTGPGGVGKSALAAEAARRLAADFADGVRFVELAPVQDAASVLAAVAQALDVERRAERSLAESIAEVLGPRQMLLVLDNCEHLVGAVGELASRVLRWCPGVRLLATSREPIGIPGEIVVKLGPLPVPMSVDDPLEVILASPAVQVFVARAEEAVPSFEITERSAPAVADLCIQLDGLPLALELAAARVASMSPQQLAARLHERFSLLGGAQGREPRHRTLSDLVQWSYELLTDKERVLMARLSVFVGGFDLEVAEEVCGVGELAPAEVAHLLATLVDKSLVVVDRDDERVRHRQLETLRQFGATRLVERSDASDVRGAHVRAFVGLARSGGLGLDTLDEARWVERLDADWGNLRAALRAATDEGDVDSALRLVADTRETAFRRIRYEVVDWAEAAVALPGATDHHLAPTALATVGYGCFVRGELDQAVELAEEAVAVRDRRGLSSCGLPERVLGNALFYRGDHAAALAWMDAMVESARASAVDGRLAHALYMRSVAQTSVGDPDGGAAQAVEVEVVAQRCGSPTALAQAAYAAGLAMAATDVAGAIERLDRAADLAHSVGNRWMRAFAMTEALWLRAGRGETTTALTGYRQVVETWFQGGDWANQWLSLRHLAGIFAGLGRDEDAALLFGAVAAAGAAVALPFSPADAAELGNVAHAVTERLGPTAEAEAARRGAMMRDDATVAAALEVISELA